MADDKRPEDLSDIEPIELPKDGFASKIPTYLLDGRPEQEQFMLIEVSKFSSFIDWIAPIIIEVHKEQRRTNGRLKALEAWKAMFTSWWGFAGAILSVIGGLAGLIAAIQVIRSAFAS